MERIRVPLPPSLPRRRHPRPLLIPTGESLAVLSSQHQKGSYFPGLWSEERGLPFEAGSGV